MPVWVRSRGLKRRPVRHDALASRAEAMLRSLGRADAELSILLCDDETIRHLNHRYRKKNRPTDVLAFPMQEGPDLAPQSPLLGDVVISLPTAARQAEERDRPIIAEVTFLLAHGLLHLLGYDHATAEEEREMRAKTDDLLAAVAAAR
jgi:probable rRNA maturation factor